MGVHILSVLAYFGDKGMPLFSLSKTTSLLLGKGKIVQL